MKEYKIALLKGDGIGPEIVNATLRLLEKAAPRHGVTFTYTDLLLGGCAYDAGGNPLPEETVAGCKAADAVLLGAVGGPKWETLPGHLRPEAALLGIRAALGLYCNLRPARLYPELASASPLEPAIREQGIDMVIVRELTGGIYFGKRGRSEDGKSAYDTETYSVEEITRIGKRAFELAKTRKNRLISVDKANVLESSRLWREVMHELAAQYPGVAYSDMLVDNAAMQLVRNPAQFDVMVTSNMFGDILSDEASMLTGSIGMLPSASVGDGARGLYEPIHGSAPDIAGQNKANPIATVLSAAMMCRHSLKEEGLAADLENAVTRVLASGARTGDIARAGEKVLTTGEMTDLLLENL